jgi:ABC-type Fe3+ transport system permease subunit
MKLNKLQKKILIILLFLCIITPVGVLLPAFVDAGDAWGEWSAQTVKELTGSVPEGLAKYSDVWKAPLPDYADKKGDPSVGHRSGFYLVSGILGATLAYGLMLLISGIIIRDGK